MQVPKGLYKVFVPLFLVLVITGFIVTARLHTKTEQFRIPAKADLKALVESLEQVIQADDSIPDTFAKSFDFDMANPNHHRFQEIMNAITVKVYSDVPSFRQMLQIIKEKEQLKSLLGDILSNGPEFYALGRRFRVADFGFYERKDLAELIDMLEATKDPQFKNYIVVAITFHSYFRSGLKILRLEHRPLTPLLGRIVGILEKEKQNVINEIMKEEKNVLSQRGFSIPGQVFWYSSLCGGILGPLYREHTLVNEFVLKRIRDRKEDVIYRVFLLYRLLWWSSKESTCVDTATEILLDLDSHRKLRETVTYMFKDAVGKIDTPNRRKYFDALCDAAESDPDEDVREKAIERIKLFDDPEAKAFLEKLKSSTEK